MPFHGIYDEAEKGYHPFQYTSSICPASNLCLRHLLWWLFITLLYQATTSIRALPSQVDTAKGLDTWTPMENGGNTCMTFGCICIEWLFSFQRWQPLEIMIMIEFECGSMISVRITLLPIITLAFTPVARSHVLRRGIIRDIRSDLNPLTNEITRKGLPRLNVAPFIIQQERQEYKHPR